MKSYRKLIAAFAILIALGIVGTAIATYYPHTPITDVSITGTLSNGDSVAISSNHTMTCTTSTDTDKIWSCGWHYPNDPVTHTWSGPGTFNPTTGTSVTWTSPSTTGNKTITVTANDSPLYNETAKTDSITVKVVKVDKLQYYCYVSAQWVDITGTLYVHDGDFVEFKAIPDPSGASWPSGKPVWGGEASGTGSTTSVTFSTLSTSTSDYKTVTAECGSGNTVAANVIVFDFDGELTPDDPFTGRNMDKYGLEETVELDCSISPSGLTGSALGGLRWKIPGGIGVGSLSSITSNGTADYDAEEVTGSANLWLEVISGPSWGHFKSYSKQVIAPSGTRMTRYSSRVKHVQGVASAGIGLWYWLDPTDVSFSNLDFGEDSCPATGKTGIYITVPPGNHAQNTFTSILGGNSTTGCKVVNYDGAYSARPSWGNGGTYTWSIPTQYIDDTSTRNTFGSNQNHVPTLQANGDATMAKGGQSGSAALNAQTSGY
ncbi:MAG: hypothetical protein GY845_28400 [Planctomycetes bacterium]|nr:hypothetical protein [Planctomycetota bacterium]